MIMAGGDGSLMTLLNLAKEAGCDISKLVCCVLPYGTGNDLARSLNWGGTEAELKIYKSLPRLVHEICLNAEEKNLNVWTVLVKFKFGGALMEIDPSTRTYFERKETFFERYMINYFSMGEDARVGTGFEKKRTNNRFCNNLNYSLIGLCNFICGVCCCRRPPLITDQVEYVRSLSGVETEKVTTDHNYLPLIVEESKE
jgi:diacylglycerol kinase (ATP)